jgi:K+-sensing histidine kinase KdpD
MFEAMLISAGGLWLGLFGLVVLSGILWASSVDSFILGSAVIFISLVTAQYFFAIPVWAAITANPFMLLVYVLLYGAIGAVYTALWRLPNYVKKNAKYIQNDYDSWKEKCQKLNSKVHNEVLDTSYDAFLNSAYYNYSVKNNKDRVASWVLLWPTSLTWELIHKPFVFIWDNVYYGLGKVFEKVNHDYAKKILENKDK